MIGDLLNPMASSGVSTRFVFFQLYASHRDDMGQANFMATQNLESLTSSMKTPTYPPHEGGFALPLTARRFIAWVWPGLSALSVGPAWVTYIEEN